MLHQLSGYCSVKHVKIYVLIYFHCLPDDFLDWTAKGTISAMDSMEFLTFPVPRWGHVLRAWSGFLLVAFWRRCSRFFEFAPIPSPSTRSSGKFMEIQFLGVETWAETLNGTSSIWIVPHMSNKIPQVWVYLFNACDMWVFRVAVSTCSTLCHFQGHLQLNPSQANGINI